MLQTRQETVDAHLIHLSTFLGICHLIPSNQFCSVGSPLVGSALSQKFAPSSLQKESSGAEQQAVQIEIK